MTGTLPATLAPHVVSPTTNAPVSETDLAASIAGSTMALLYVLGAPVLSTSEALANALNVMADHAKRPGDVPSSVLRGAAQQIMLTELSERRNPL